MVTLPELQEVIHDAEKEIAVIVQRVMSDYDLTELKVEVCLQNLKNFSQELIDEIYGDLVLNPMGNIKLGVGVNILIRP